MAGPTSYNFHKVDYSVNNKKRVHKGFSIPKEQREYDPMKYSNEHSNLVIKGLYWKLMN